MWRKSSLYSAFNPELVRQHVVAAFGAYVEHHFRGSATTSTTVCREALWKCLRSGT